MRQGCQTLDIPAGPLRRLADLQGDPNLQETGFFIALQDPKLGALIMPDAPLKFDGAGARPTLPPRLGQHTVEVLQAAGVRLGQNQALPIVDHAVARDATLARYAVVKKAGA